MVLLDPRVLWVDKVSQEIQATEDPQVALDLGACLVCQEKTGRQGKMVNLDLRDPPVHLASEVCQECLVYRGPKATVVSQD